MINSDDSGEYDDDDDDDNDNDVDAVTFTSHSPAGLSR